MRNLRLMLLLAVIVALFSGPFSFGTFGQTGPIPTPGPGAVDVPGVEDLQGLVGSYVDFTGVVEQWAPPAVTDGPIEYYLLRGITGNHVWVRITTSPPYVNDQLEVKGVVGLPPDPFLTTNAIVTETGRTVIIPVLKERGDGQIIDRHPSSPLMAWFADIMDPTKAGYPYKLIGVIVAFIALIAGIALLFSGRQPAAVPVPQMQPNMMASPNPGAVQGTTIQMPPSQPTRPSWGSIQIIAGPNTGKVFPLLSDTVQLGRDPRADIYLPDESAVVSSKHGRIVRAIGGRVSFVDESTNGSRVNEQSVKGGEIALASNSVITVGPYKLKVLDLHTGPEIQNAPTPTQAVGSVPRGQSSETREWMGAELNVVSGDKDKGKRLPITKYAVTIGRGQDQDFQLSDDYASRQHAVLTYTNSEWTVQNVSKTEQGTVLNGKKIDGTEKLKPGDRIGIGTTVIEFSSTVGG